VLVNTYPAAGGNSPESVLWIQNLVDGLAGFTLKAKSAVFCDASPFQKIEVFDTYAFGRVLLLGGSIVMTERDEYIYNEMISHPALVSHPAPRSVCIVGGGDGGSLREVLKHECIQEVTVVEIDAHVTETVKRHFSSLADGFDDPRVELVFDDGYNWLNNNEKRFDVIVVDSYDPAGPVQSLETDDFLELVRNRLNDNGLAVFQTGSPVIRAEHIRRSMRRLATLFASASPYICTIPSFPLSVCGFLLCTTGQAGEAADTDRQKRVREQCRYYCESVHQGAFLLPRDTAALFRENG
jgi:spermidine synthase